ncbi:hypothetical protein GGR56DRAFT_651748 [Xylariaceae sp. FL0804]|nr:hypothetical protein GGR56DRAFT_651748 [Xylariaceae sp. FL0804]
MLTVSSGGGERQQHRDPTDATQVPPSVMQKHVGGPAVAHNDAGHGHDRRHGSQSAQETHRGL